ncbi:CPBP family intramembrane glutamic endopeptidase [Natrinema sp. CBA1119]|uniref:CPBP family intramembrane glutamic endopeptidase n=1 Tax=Natrinema sp. CBA1119 TaxID=1608465 RepID=UPI00159BE601|nr:CPBP family intramembrane glutamic endopeptidase [Natrinema sp. CBA1119]
MTDPDSGRIGIFVGILLVAAAALVLIAASLDMNPITLAPAYMFSPMVAGLAVCLSQGIPLADAGLQRGRLRWLAAAAVVALPLIGLTLAFALAIPGIGFDPTADPIPGVALPPGLLGVAVTVGLALVLGATVNAIFAFGEEFGWRGYLLWELAPWGFWKASFAIGALWGIWHTPVIVAGYNYPSFPYIGVIAMTIACLSFSPVYTYIVLRARSVLAAAILHGVFNGSAGLVGYCSD